MGYLLRRLPRPATTNIPPALRCSKEDQVRSPRSPFQSRVAQTNAEGQLTVKVKVEARLLLPVTPSLSAMARRRATTSSIRAARESERRL